MSLAWHCGIKSNKTNYYMVLWLSNKYIHEQINVFSTHQVKENQKCGIPGAFSALSSCFLSFGSLKHLRRRLILTRN